MNTKKMQRAYWAVLTFTLVMGCAAGSATSGDEDGGPLDVPSRTDDGDDVAIMGIQRNPLEHFQASKVFMQVGHPYRAIGARS